MNEPDTQAYLARERPGFVRFVRSLFGEDQADADPEDVVQDVLLSLLERGDQPAPEYLAAYLYRSLRNRVIDRLRTRRNTVSLDAERADGGRLIDMLEDHYPNALQVLQSEAGRRALFSALETLSDMQRQVIVAHELEGEPFRDLSERLGVPVNTLLSHKARGMKRLRQHFLDNQGDDT